MRATGARAAGRPCHWHGRGRGTGRRAAPGEGPAFDVAAMKVKSRTLSLLRFAKLPLSRKRERGSAVTRSRFLGALLCTAIIGMSACLSTATAAPRIGVVDHAARRDLLRALRPRRDRGRRSGAGRTDFVQLRLSSTWTRHGFVGRFVRGDMRYMLVALAAGRRTSPTTATSAAASRSSGWRSNRGEADTARRDARRKRKARERALPLRVLPRQLLHPRARRARPRARRHAAPAARNPLARQHLPQRGGAAGLARVLDVAGFRCRPRAVRRTSRTRCGRTPSCRCVSPRACAGEAQRRPCRWSVSRK